MIKSLKKVNIVLACWENQMHMTNSERKKISRPQISGQDSNAEYAYIIENKEVWFIDYIIGVAFKTPRL
jgi:hypothetical protein